MDSERVVSLLRAWMEEGPLAEDVRDDVVAGGARLRSTDEFEDIVVSMASTYGKVAYGVLPTQLVSPTLLGEAFLAGLTLGLSFAACDEADWEL